MFYISVCPCRQNDNIFPVHSSKVDANLKSIFNHWGCCLHAEGIFLVVFFFNHYKVFFLFYINLFGKKNVLDLNEDLGLKGDYCKNYKIQIPNDNVLINPSSLGVIDCF